MTIPRKINLGSGKDFRPDYLNIDINNQWLPDIIADVSQPFPAGDRQSFTTKRFGEVVVEAGTFEEIISNDVLEHVPDLVATMTNCLRLLKTGGLFNIGVPYDLAYGAWQDPTHLRAFNEKSWLYFTDWFWYLGWQTHRFQIKNLKFVLNPLGIAMQKQNVPQDVILRTPRAVDAMRVSLEKAPLSENDKAQLKRYTPPLSRG